MPLDGSSNQRMTSNPLMLSMVASLFELKSETNEPMPKTVVQLYDQASRMMLERAGKNEAAQMLPLLKALFFEAHTAGRRWVTERHISAAVSKVPNGEQARGVLLRLARVDRMPLLSVLQTRPLRLQASHLSFQEYFAARAICEGAVLPTRPWQLPVSWANAVRLGVEMGEAFGHGLLKSASPNLEAESLQVSIGGHHQTAATALAAALQVADAVKQVRVGKNFVHLEPLRRGEFLLDQLDDSDAIMIAGFLGLASTDQTLSLAKSRISSKGIVVLSERAPKLTHIDISGNSSLNNKKAMRALGDTLCGSSTSHLGALTCDAFDVPMGAAMVNLNGKVGNLEAVPLLAGMCMRITSISLRNNSLGPKEAKLLAMGVRASGSLKAIDLAGNKLCSGGGKAIAEAIRGSRSLEDLK